jgi:hypothetical protein
MATVTLTFIVTVTLEVKKTDEVIVTREDHNGVSLMFTVTRHGRVTSR